VGIVTGVRAGTLQQVGLVRSALRDRRAAPKQGREGAPEAWIEVMDVFAPALDGLAAGQDVILVTWLHQARRDVLQVHPRDDPSAALSGVFATRSADRPNPLGLHRVKILEIRDKRLRVRPLEAVDGTPVVDIKPVLPAPADS
jgi:tRNA-Thr(GGU) m(6)t(6)A37 methyltransferase TsaA